MTTATPITPTPPTFTGVQSIDCKGVCLRIQESSLGVPGEYSVTVQGKKTAVKPTTARLLKYLMENPGERPRDEILRSVWIQPATGRRVPASNVIAVYVSYARRAAGPDAIRTRPKGYEFVGIE